MKERESGFFSSSEVEAAFAMCDAGRPSVEEVADALKLGGGFARDGARWVRTRKTGNYFAPSVPCARGVPVSATVGRWKKSGRWWYCIVGRGGRFLTEPDYVAGGDTVGEAQAAVEKVAATLVNE